MSECTYKVGDRTVDEARRELTSRGMKEEDLGMLENMDLI